MSLKSTVICLQVLAGLIFVMGLVGLVIGILSPRMFAVFGVLVPSTVCAAVFLGIGAYYWVRASKLKQRVMSGNVL